MGVRNSSSARSQRGAIAITATFFAIAIAGIAMALLSEVDASKKMFDRGESSVRSLEAAETGVVLAEQEISSGKDTGVDGIGNLTGALNGVAFVVSATQDPVLTDQWTLRSRGTQGSSARTIEVRVRRLAGSNWNYGMFAASSITISGGGTTDSYDSRLGTYASQARNSDKFGSYAQRSGPIGSNGTILVSSSEVRGDSSAGPGYTTTLQGSGTVTGSLSPLPKTVSIPDTPLATFVASSTVNDNLKWSATGGLTYNPVTKALTISGGNTITLTGSTYFFSKLVLSGGSTLRITSGPVKIYVTDQIDFSGGTLANVTGSPVNLQFYQAAYPLPLGYVPSKKSATLSGGSGSDFIYYGPSTPVTVSGKGDVFGSIVGKSIVSSGGSKVHYDLALLGEMEGGHAPIRRIYWRDLAPPRR